MRARSRSVSLLNHSPPDMNRSSSRATARLARDAPGRPGRATDAAGRLRSRCPRLRGSPRPSESVVALLRLRYWLVFEQALDPLAPDAQLRARKRDRPASPAMRQRALAPAQGPPNDRVGSRRSLLVCTSCLRLRPAERLQAAPRTGHPLINEAPGWEIPGNRPLGPLTSGSERRTI